MSQFNSVFKNKTVLVTGHTGFTGPWLCLWLKTLGAKVIGVGLNPLTAENMFSSVDLQNKIEASYILNINNYQDVKDIFDKHKPDFVFHLAAQALVRKSYHETLETFETNVMGTANILEAARHNGSVKAGVFVTTDKVYKNMEWVWPYREHEALGGKDPYSASKSAAEMVLKSYAESFFHTADSMNIAVARGGNIVGGGDWSDDRLVPDFVRSIVNKTKLTIRNPNATRPWQHVLALCHGYLCLAEKLITEPEIATGAWNLGPRPEDAIAVSALIEKFGEVWQEPSIEHVPADLAEAQLLALDSSKAKTRLQWSPPWHIDEVIAMTADWYRRYYDGEISAHDLTLEQIETYQKAI